MQNNNFIVKLITVTVLTVLIHSQGTFTEAFYAKAEIMENEDQGKMNEGMFKLEKVGFLFPTGGTLITTILNEDMLDPENTNMVAVKEAIDEQSDNTVAVQYIRNSNAEKDQIREDYMKRWYLPDCKVLPEPDVETSFSGIIIPEIKMSLNMFIDQNEDNLNVYDLIAFYGRTSHLIHSFQCQGKAYCNSYSEGFAITKSKSLRLYDLSSFEEDKCLVPRNNGYYEIGMHEEYKAGDVDSFGLQKGFEMLFLTN